MTIQTIKKYIKQYGEDACIVAYNVAMAGEGAFEAHYQAAKKCGFEHKPDEKNRWRIGDGLIAAGEWLTKNKPLIIKNGAWVYPSHIKD